MSPVERPEWDTPRVFPIKCARDPGTVPVGTSAGSNFFLDVLVLDVLVLGVLVFGATDTEEDPL